MDTATKEKHPGRVAQGHKLVEQRQVSTSQALCSSGAVVIIAGAVAWYFWSAKKPPENAPQKTVDIFAMR